MTAAQKDFLREWILEQDLLGFPPSRARVRQMALRMFGDDKPLDNSWVQEYLQRHPNAKMCVASQLRNLLEPVRHSRF